MTKKVSEMTEAQHKRILENNRRRYAEKFSTKWDEIGDELFYSYMKAKPLAKDPLTGDE